MGVVGVKLSILIPTMPKRGAFLARLMAILEPQVSNDVEILTAPGAGSIGSKRNALIAEAKGEFVAFVDDDDRVSGDYISELLAGISKGVDVVAIRGIWSKNGGPGQEFIDLPYQEHSGQIGVGVFLRGVQHLDAVRRSIAIQVPYKDTSFGEDKDWTETIEATGLVKTWHQVDHPIYFYEYRTRK